jgi:hypothetical protein
MFMVRSFRNHASHLLELGTLKVLYTIKAAAKLPMALATSLAPWEKDIAQALITCSTCTCEHTAAQTQQ